MKSSENQIERSTVEAKGEVNDAGSQELEVDL